ncbi:phage protein F-like protein [Peptostreptococcaceae bacterium AS15]|nr:phage protein F-like protein [Peptostreptococcaceae bacterium AS15]
MNTKEYFEKRALATEKHSKDRGEKYLEELKKSYEEIEKLIQNDIDAWHKKYADNDESISNINARKPLKHEELKEYLENIKNKIENSNLSDDDKATLKQGYLSSKLNRLESLLKQTELNLKILTKDYENSSKEHLAENYKQSYSEAAHSLYACPTVNFDLTFDRFDNRAIENIVNAKWSNKDFSERIWGHYSNMASDLQGILNVGIALGYSVDKMSRQVRDRMDVNFSNAKRLIRTESNYILSEATQQLYKDVGLEKYQFLATLDFRTSEICQSLDGKVFEVNKRQIGVNCNPMHPNCRSTTIPYLEEYQDEGDTRLARDMDGKNYKVPANMNYKAWYESMSREKQDIKSNDETGKVLNIHDIKNATLRKSFENLEDILSRKSSNSLHATKMSMYLEYTEYEEDTSLNVPFAYFINQDKIKYNTKHPNFYRYDFIEAQIHEMSHRMDMLEYKSYENTKFLKAIKNSKKIYQKNEEKIKKWFDEKNGLYSKEGSVSDIISALTKGKANSYLLLGHEEKYWKDARNVPLEIFANLSYIDIIDKEKHTEFKSVFNELIEAYLEVVS